MKKTGEVLDANTGNMIPVTVDLKVNPLMYKKRPVVNGNGRKLMDNEWVYVNCGGYGNVAINVNRANYCKKIYLSNISIIESIGLKKITSKLQSFIDQVSDKLVFEKDGTSYRVYLSYNKRKKEYDLNYVWPYWATVGTGGIAPAWDSVSAKYKSHPGWDYEINEDGSKGKHRLNVDLKQKFGYEN